MLDTRSTETHTRWWILGISLWATASSFLFINGFVFLIPSLAAATSTSLTEAGLIASMPSWGMVVTLIPWGYAVDRAGERAVLTVGSGLTAVMAFTAATLHSLVLVAVVLFLGGMAAAGCNAAGGRLVSEWFPPHQRGLAMGIRQISQPLGIALGAVVMPKLAQGDALGALLCPAAFCAIAAVVSAILIDPPRNNRRNAQQDELASPYGRSNVLWRIHAVSALLMMPQTVVVTFMLVWLVEHRGWSIGAAGALVTVCQVLGALGRIGVGRWSDRVGSRMHLVRLVAIGAAVGLFALAFSDFTGSKSAVLLMIVVAVVSVLDNGLAATAITESAGPFWCGRALGTQNTAQRVAAAAAPALFGAVITSTTYPLAWALCALFPLLAIRLVPRPRRVA
jgi:MFS family permease